MQEKPSVLSVVSRPQQCCTDLRTHVAIRSKTTVIPRTHAHNTDSQTADLDAVGLP